METCLFDAYCKLSDKYNVGHIIGVYTYALIDKLKNDWHICAYVFFHICLLSLG